MDETSPFTGLGLILLGALFLAVPYLGRFIDLEKVLWWVICVYRSGGFTFATSPLLILLSLASALWRILRR